MEQRTCTKCQRKFRIIDPEKKLIEEFGLLLPTICYLCREERRREARNRTEFFEADCKKCGVKLFVTVPPEKQKMLYCKPCYQDYVTSEKA